MSQKVILTMLVDQYQRVGVTPALRFAYEIYNNARHASERTPAGYFSEAALKAEAQGIIDGLIERDALMPETFARRQPE